MNDLDDEGIRGLEVRSLEAIALLAFNLSDMCDANESSRSEVMQLNADALL